jgi:hypothetical protein
MSQNSFLLNPMKVVRMPSMQTFVFLGDIPRNVANEIKPSGIGKTAKAFYGSLWASRLGQEKITEVIGGDELSVFEELLEDKPAEQVATAGSLQYLTFPPVYPEDKLSELKEKIQIATGIPTYRQHLFYVNSGGVQTTYRHAIDGPVSVDIRAMAPAGVLGLPIDNFMVSRRESLRTSAYDTIRSVDNEFDLGHIAYVVDLLDYITPIISQLRERIDDPHTFMQVYYGFVVKYWPALSPNAFNSLIVRPSELPVLYPDLAPTTPMLISRYRAESEIIGKKYAESAVIEKWAEEHISVAVVQMIAFVSPLAKTMINIRNLFDKLRVSVIIPEIQAWIDVNGVKYILRKRHIKNGSDIGFPTRSIFREGITMAISLRKRDQESFHEKLTHSTAENEQSRYLFLNIQPNGVYYMKTMWNEEDHLELDEVIEIVAKFVSPIITGVNGLGRLVFLQGSKLAELSSSTIRFDTLSICLFWGKTINEGLQKLLRAQWEPYLQARITAPRNVIQPDRYEFLFRKGMYDFDPAHVDRIMSMTVIGAENQYAYLTMPAVKTKWEQNFEGRVVRMSLRSSDVRFEVLNIRRDEFEIFYGFIADFCHKCGKVPQIRDNSANISATADQKLNRLKEQDPDLFNLKKHGTNRQYSVLCQKPRQPIAYTDDEIKRMSKADLAKLTKFYNFTFKRPAYYGCPSKNYPHMAFITGVHPKNYCLPCCNKKANVEGRSREKIQQACLEAGIYAGEKGVGPLGHVMAYGKALDVGRMSKTPPEMEKILIKPSAGNYYLLGVPQTFGAMKYAGILHACAEVMGVSADEILDKASEVIGDGVSRLLGGRIGEYFDENVFAALRATTISRNLQKFTRMPELIVELIYRTYNICVFTVIDEYADGRSAFYFTPEQLETSRDASGYILVLKSVNRFYPFIFEGEKRYGIFSGESALITSIHKCMEYGRGSAKPVARTLDLATLRGIAEPSQVYVNRQNYVYATNVLGACVSVDYSTPAAGDKIVKEYRLNISTGKVLADALAQINSKLPREFTPLVPTKRILSTGRMVGVFAGGMLHRCTDGFDDLPEEECGYDIDGVNSAIIAKLAPTPDNTAGISAAIWRNYQYQLFLIQFVAFIESERGAEVREAIDAAITRRDFARELGHFKEDLAKILADHPADNKLILSQLAQHYQSKKRKELLREAINQSVYDFDRKKLSALVAMSDADRLAEVRKIAKSFAVEDRSFDPTGRDFPNVYLPCNGQQSYCDGTKLIVHDLEEFCNLLSADIADPLQRISIQNMSWADTIIDPFKFSQSPAETIVVYKILN